MSNDNDWTATGLRSKSGFSLGMLFMALVWAFCNATNHVEWWGPLLTAAVIGVMHYLAYGSDDP